MFSYSTDKETISDKIKGKVNKVKNYVNKKTIIVCIICVLVGVFIGWKLFRTDIYDNGNTANTAREQLERTGEYQSDAIERIGGVRDGLTESIEAVNRAEERTDRITESAKDLQDRNTRINNAIRESQSRVTESLNIIEAIRATKR